MHRLIFGMKLSLGRIGTPVSTTVGSFRRALPSGPALKAKSHERLREIGDEASRWDVPQAHPFELRVLRQPDVLLWVGLQDERDGDSPTVMVEVLYERPDPD